MLEEERRDDEALEESLIANSSENTTCDAEHEDEASENIMVENEHSDNTARDNVYSGEIEMDGQQIMGEQRYGNV